MTEMNEGGVRKNDITFDTAHGGQAPFHESEWGKNSEFSFSEIRKESDSKETKTGEPKQSGNYSRLSHPYAGGRFSREHFGLGSDSWGQMTPSFYRPSNSQLYENICHALYLSPLVDASFIEVHVQDGVVTLTGTVRDRPMKKNAENCIEYLSGIKDVMNRLQLQM